MQITTEMDRGVLELRLQGRLDNDAADDFVATMDDVLRKGHHAATLDMRGVDYISSAGLGALVRVLKKFQAIHGAFGVSSSSPQVAKALELTGLAKLLVIDAEKVREKQAGGNATIEPSFRVAAADGLELAIYDLDPPEKLRCQVFGNAGRLDTNQFAERESWKVQFPGDSFGLGIGAFGRDDVDCRDRFGELLAVAGGVAVQPTPEGVKSDYQLASGEFIPQPHLLYGLSFAGDFSQMIRFESQTSAGRTGLSALVDQCLERSGAGLTGMVIVAEAAGLIGTKLRRSPVAANGGSGATFNHPEIRNWYSFTSAHVFPHSLVVIVGVAARGIPCGDAADVAPLLRPLSPNLDIHGHFHAAVFSFRPLKKRRLNLQETVRNLFDNEDLQAVLHLLHDDRPISGNGESELVSGACWVGPIGHVAREGNAI